MFGLRCLSDLQVDDVGSADKYMSPELKGRVRARDTNLGSCRHIDGLKATNELIQGHNRK